MQVEADQATQADQTTQVAQAQALQDQTSQAVQAAQVAAAQQHAQQHQAIQFQLMQQHLMHLAGSTDPNNPLAGFHSPYPFFMPNLNIDHSMFGAGGKPRKPGVVEKVKSKHNESEQRRRDNINKYFDELKTLLPQHQSNKHAILQSAVDYIRKLQRQGEHLIMLNKDLRDENDDIVRFLQTTSVFFNTRDNPEMAMGLPPQNIQQQPFPGLSHYNEADLQAMNVPFSPQSHVLSSVPMFAPTIPQVEIPPPAVPSNATTTTTTTTTTSTTSTTSTTTTEPKEAASTIATSAATAAATLSAVPNIAAAVVSELPEIGKDKSNDSQGGTSV